MRLLVRVKAGAVPNEDSQEKYKLSLAEINVVRADAGLPELDRPYRVNAFAGMMAINAETERLQGEVLEQMNLDHRHRCKYLYVVYPAFHFETIQPKPDLKARN